MIPTMIAVGVVLAAVSSRWTHRPRTVGVLAGLASLGLGIAVGAPLAGTAVALVNVAFGLGVGLAIQRWGRAWIAALGKPWVFWPTLLFFGILSYGPSGYGGTWVWLGVLVLTGPAFAAAVYAGTHRGDNLVG